MKQRLLWEMPLLIFGMMAQAQELAVKTNLLYDATTTPNIGIEAGIGRKYTLQAVYGINPWTFHSSHGDRMARHWVVMPELRRWSCTKFNGHFFGVHLMGGELNVGNVDMPVPGFFLKGENMRKGARRYDYQGCFAGGGLTYGYQWILGRHWNVEAEVGAGYAHVWYDKYPCYECGAKLGDGHANYLGITKLGLSVLYIF